MAVLCVGKHLYCANVGDSRALLAYVQAPYNTLAATALSSDHKPERIDECDRIQGCKGRIDSYHDAQGKQVGPLRVWLAEEDVPGLAMTRSMGDSVGAQVGVLAEPGRRGGLTA